MRLGVGGRSVFLLVIMAELNQDEISWFQVFKNLLPPAFISETFCASSAGGTIFDVHAFDREFRKTLDPALHWGLPFRIGSGSGIASGKNRDVSRGISGEGRRGIFLVRFLIYVRIRVAICQIFLFRVKGN